MNIPIKGFIENSLVEWEGKIVSIIFLPTCNFLCHYCHAPHLVQTPNDLESIPLESVTKKLQQSFGWIDGIVVSGGEPTMYKELGTLLKIFKDIGVLVRVDTNGTNPYILRDLIAKGLLDCVAMDIKAPLRKSKYEEITGTPCNIEDIIKSIHIIMESDIEYEFRTTVCPSQLDQYDIEDIAISIRGAERYILQSFRPNHCLNTEMLKERPYSHEVLREFAMVAGRYVEYCCVRGEEGKVLSRNW
ncbi:MAG: anaerobic ribonucleoside-triphosphate reductase activating protein [Candidatus Kuenenia sp.]|nr:anaerobic ribonucleoside-triphosphate reductase activating protein [Candidatus Kuenenia hertensis]